MRAADNWRRTSSVVQWVGPWPCRRAQSFNVRGSTASCTRGARHICIQANKSHNHAAAQAIFLTDDARARAHFKTGTKELTQGRGQRLIDYDIVHLCSATS